MGTKGDALRLAAGFSALCCVNVVCFFPDALAAGADAPWLRAYNATARPTECAVLMLLAVGAFRARRRTVAAGVAAGYASLLCGLCAPAVFGHTPASAAIAGVCCGGGLAVTMAFWFGLLTGLPEKRQAVVQGCQALAGELAFLALLGANAAMPAAIALCILSAGCALFSRRFARIAIDDERPAVVARFVARTKADLAAPCAGYLAASLVYGAAVALARGTDAAASLQAAPWIGAPVGAAAFIVWVKTSRRRDYAGAGEWALALAALAPLAPPGIATLAFSAVFQFAGLVLFSLLIDRLSAQPRAAVACVAAAYGMSHLLFFAGLYLPGAFDLPRTAAPGMLPHVLGLLSGGLFCMALAAKAFRARARCSELEAQCADYERLVESQRGEIARRDEESALLKTAAFDKADCEYDLACRLIAKDRGLTKRETEILSLLARGRDIAFICSELYLARNTVKGYTKRIYAKLEIHSKQEAIDAVHARMEAGREAASNDVQGA